MAEAQKQQQMHIPVNSTDLNYDMINYLQEMLTAKSTELEMTAEYGLDLSSQNEQLSNDLVGSQHEVAQLKAANRVLETELNSVRIALAEKRDEEASLTPRTRSGQGGSRDEELRAHISEQNMILQQNKIKQLAQELQESNEAGRVLEETIEEGKERENWLKGQVTRLKDKMGELEDDRLRWREDEMILHEQLAQLQKQNGGDWDSEELQEEIARLKTDKGELKHQVARLLKQIDELKKKLDDLQEDGVGTQRRFDDDDDSFGADNDLADYDELDAYEEPDVEVSPRREEPAEEEEEESDEAESPTAPPKPKKSSKLLEIEANLERARDYIDKNEVAMFAQYFNRTFEKDEELQGKLPVEATVTSIHSACRDGMLLCKMVNHVEPGTIDERVINRATDDEEAKENFNLCLDSCRAIGCHLPVEMDVDAILSAADCQTLCDIIWSMIKMKLDKHISLAACPELSRVGGQDESVEDLSALSPEQLLLRWVNFLLKHNKSLRRVKRYDEDLTDCEVQALLMQKLNGVETSFLQERDLRERAHLMLDAFGAKHPQTFLMTNAGGVLDRNPNLLYALLANLLKLNHGLERLTQREQTEIDTCMHTTSEWDGDREAKVFTLWINSLGVKDTVNNIFEDLRDGLILLKVFDKLNPGSVDWKSVATKRPIPKFMRLQNCNYVVKLCKVMQFSLVGIAGDDIESGNHKMTLAVVWQMMAYHIHSILESLSSTGKRITDVELIAWANEKVKEAGSDLSIKSFKDKTLKDGLYFLNLMNGIRPNSIQKNLIKYGQSEEDFEQNAKYAISVSRKLGAHIFVCVDDLVNVRAKMMFTWVAALMAATRMGELPAKPVLRRPVTLTTGHFKGKLSDRKGNQPQAQAQQQGNANGVPSINVPTFNGFASQSPALAPPTPRTIAHAATKKQVKALEAQVQQILGENRQLQETNKNLCREVGKLRAQLMGQFVAAARTRTVYENAQRK